MIIDVSSCGTKRYTLFKRPFKVTVCAVTLMAFLFNTISYDLGWATETTTPLIGNKIDNSAARISTVNVENFELPKYLGYIKDKFKGNSDKVVLHIQDAHCNYAAQNSIYSIIDALNKMYGVDVINLEGGEDEYDLSAFGKIESDSSRKAVSDYFLKEGEINAAEFYAVNNPGKLHLWGIENTDIYLENLNVYRDSLKNKETVDASVSILENYIDKLKAKVYSKELRALDLRLVDFKEKKIELKEYITYLSEISQAKNIYLDDLNNVNLFNQVVSLEKAIDFKRSNVERDKLVELLAKSLSKDEVRELAAKTLEFKIDKVPAVEFYAYLVKKSYDVNMDMSEYSDLNRYIDYIKLYSLLKHEELLNEIETLESRIKAALFRSDIEKELDKNSIYIAILKELLSITLTPDHYKYYREHRQDFSAGNISRFIKREAPKYYIDIKNIPDSNIIDTQVRELEKFFELSFKRDEEFTRRLKFSTPSSKLSAPNSRIAILITGGFHTENLTLLFKKQNISYVSIMPNFKLDGNDCPYFSLLSGKNSGLLKYIMAKTSNIAVYTYFCKNAERIYGPNITQAEVREGWIRVVDELLNGCSASEGDITLEILSYGESIESGEKICDWSGGKSVWAVGIGGQAAQQVMPPGLISLTTKSSSGLRRLGAFWSSASLLVTVLIGMKINTALWIALPIILVSFLYWANRFILISADNPRNSYRNDIKIIALIHRFIEENFGHDISVRLEDSLDDPMSYAHDLKSGRGFIVIKRSVADLFINGNPIQRLSFLICILHETGERRAYLLRIAPYSLSPVGLLFNSHLFANLWTLISLHNLPVLYKRSLAAADNAHLDRKPILTTQNKSQQLMTILTRVGIDQGVIAYLMTEIAKSDSPDDLEATLEVLFLKLEKAGSKKAVIESVAREILNTKVQRLEETISEFCSIIDEISNTPDGPSMRRVIHALLKSDDVGSRDLLSGIRGFFKKTNTYGFELRVKEIIFDQLSRRDDIKNISEALSSLIDVIGNRFSSENIGMVLCSILETREANEYINQLLELFVNNTDQQQERLFKFLDTFMRHGFYDGGIMLLLHINKIYPAYFKDRIAHPSDEELSTVLSIDELGARKRLAEDADSNLLDSYLRDFEMMRFLRLRYFLAKGKYAYAHAFFVDDSLPDELESRIESTVYALLLNNQRIIAFQALQHIDGMVGTDEQARLDIPIEMNPLPGVPDRSMFTVKDITRILKKIFHIDFSEEGLVKLLQQFGYKKDERNRIIPLVSNAFVSGYRGHRYSDHPGATNLTYCVREAICDYGLRGGAIKGDEDIAVDSNALHEYDLVLLHMAGMKKKGSVSVTPLSFNFGGRALPEYARKRSLILKTETASEHVQQLHVWQYKERRAKQNILSILRWLRDGAITKHDLKMAVEILDAQVGILKQDCGFNEVYFNTIFGYMKSGFFKSLRSDLEKYGHIGSEHFGKLMDYLEAEENMTIGTFDYEDLSDYYLHNGLIHTREQSGLEEVVLRPRVPPLTQKAERAVPDFGNTRILLKDLGDFRTGGELSEKINRIFAELSMSREFLEAYSIHIGILGEFSLEEHTARVLKRFEIFYHANKGILIPQVSPELFRAMLILHDIGKPRAIEKISMLRHKAISISKKHEKEIEHEETVRIIVPMLTSLGFNDDDIRIAVAVIGNNAIGSLLTYAIDVETSDEKDGARDMIQGIAQENGIPSWDLFMLMSLYYTVDASSYPLLSHLFAQADNNGLNIAHPRYDELYCSILIDALTAKINMHDRPIDKIGACLSSSDIYKGYARYLRNALISLKDLLSAGTNPAAYIKSQVLPAKQIRFLERICGQANASVAQTETAALGPSTTRIEEAMPAPHSVMAPIGLDVAAEKIREFVVKAREEGKPITIVLDLDKTSSPDSKSEISDDTAIVMRDALGSDDIDIVLLTMRSPEEIDRRVLNKLRAHGVSEERLSRFMCIPDGGLGLFPERRFSESKVQELMKYIAELFKESGVEIDPHIRVQTQSTEKNYFIFEGNGLLCDLSNTVRPGGEDIREELVKKLYEELSLSDEGIYAFIGGRKTIDITPVNKAEAVDRILEMIAARRGGELTVDDIRVIAIDDEHKPYGSGRPLLEAGAKRGLALSPLGEVAADSVNMSDAPPNVSLVLSDGPALVQATLLAAIQTDHGVVGDDHSEHKITPDEILEAIDDINKSWSTPSIINKNFVADKVFGMGLVKGKTALVVGPGSFDVLPVLLAKLGIKTSIIDIDESAASTQVTQNNRFGVEVDINSSYDSIGDKRFDYIIMLAVLNTVISTSNDQYLHDRYTEFQYTAFHQSLLGKDRAGIEGEAKTYIEQKIKAVLRMAIGHLNPEGGYLFINIPDQGIKETRLPDNNIPFIFKTFYYLKKVMQELSGEFKSKYGVDLEIQSQMNIDNLSLTPIYSSEPRIGIVYMSRRVVDNVPYDAIMRGFNQDDVNTWVASGAPIDISKLQKEREIIERLSSGDWEYEVRTLGRDLKLDDAEAQGLIDNIHKARDDLLEHLSNNKDNKLETAPARIEITGNETRYILGGANTDISDKVNYGKLGYSQELLDTLPVGLNAEYLFHEALCRLFPGEAGHQTARRIQKILFKGNYAARIAGTGRDSHADLTGDLTVKLREFIKTKFSEELRARLHTDVLLAVKGLRKLNDMSVSSSENMRKFIKLNRAKLRPLYAGVLPEIDLAGPQDDIVSEMENSGDGNFIVIDHRNGISSLINVEAARNVMASNPDIFPKDAIIDTETWLRSNVKRWYRRGHAYGLLSGFSRNGVDRYRLFNTLMSKITADERYLVYDALQNSSFSKENNIADLRKYVGDTFMGRIKEEEIDILLERFMVQSPLFFCYIGFGEYDHIWVREMEKIYYAAEKMVDGERAAQHEIEVRPLMTGRKMPSAAAHSFRTIDEFLNNYTVGPLGHKDPARKLSDIISDEMPAALYAIEKINEVRKLMDMNGKRDRPLILWQNMRLGELYPYFNESLKRKMGIVEITEEGLSRMSEWDESMLGRVRNARFTLIRTKVSSASFSSVASKSPIKRIIDLSVGEESPFTGSPLVIIDHSRLTLSNVQEYMNWKGADGSFNNSEGRAFMSSLVGDHSDIIAISPGSTDRLENKAESLKKNFLLVLLNPNQDAGRVSWFDSDNRLGDRQMFLGKRSNKYVAVDGKRYKFYDLFREAYGNAIEARVNELGAVSPEALPSDTDAARNIENYPEEALSSSTTLLNAVAERAKPRIIIIPIGSDIYRGAYEGIGSTVRHELEAAEFSPKIFFYDGTRAGLEAARVQATSELENPDALALVYVGPAEDQYAMVKGEGGVFEGLGEKVQCVREEIAEGAFEDVFLHVALGLGILDYVHRKIKGYREKYDGGKLADLMRRMAAIDDVIGDALKDPDKFLSDLLQGERVLAVKINFKYLEDLKRASDKVDTSA